MQYTRLMLLTLVVGCGPGASAGSSAIPPVVESPAQAAAEPEVLSLLGRKLVSPPLPADVLEDRTAKMNAAKAAYDADPESEEAAVWYGRRLAYLGRYNDAIEVYSEALRVHPNSARLLRHRGHRYITIRKLPEATQDLERAAVLFEGEPDVVEQDGLPNAAGIPTGTLRTNITYHLGLAHFLSGRFAEAEAAYRVCLTASTTDDMRVATSHWLYMTLRRLGKDAEAHELLAPIRAEGMTIYENHAYHQLLLLYRGEVAEAELTDPEAEAITAATTAFGVGHWRLLAGERDAALRTFEGIVSGEQWAAFGYIAAEAELARGSTVASGR